MSTDRTLATLPSKPEKAHDEKTALARAAGYEHRRANFWEDRCRVAVEALEHYDSVVFVDLSAESNDRVKSPARDALRKIGELPEEYL